MRHHGRRVRRPRRRRPEPLLAFLAASPSPYHAVADAAARLEAAGFTPLDETDGVARRGRSPLRRRGGALVAWRVPARRRVARRVPHRRRPHRLAQPADQAAARHRRGGLAPARRSRSTAARCSTRWLDRDLGLSGRVGAPRDGADARSCASTGRSLRVPQLAIHLDREVNERGLVLDRQQHLTPGVGPRAVTDAGRLPAFVADELGVGPATSSAGT